jgi:hypothetical protein
VVNDAIVGCHRPEVREVGIIAVGQDARLWHIAFEKLLWPEYARSFVCPCCLAVPSHPMDEDYTVLRG